MRRSIPKCGSVEFNYGVIVETCDPEVFTVYRLLGEYLWDEDIETQQKQEWVEFYSEEPKDLLNNSEVTASIIDRIKCGEVTGWL